MVIINRKVEPGSLVQEINQKHMSIIMFMLKINVLQSLSLASLSHFAILQNISIPLYTTVYV